MHEARRTIAAFRMCTKIAKRVTTIILLYYVHGTLSIICTDSGGETYTHRRGTVHTDSGFRNRAAAVRCIYIMHIMFM